MTASLVTSGRRSPDAGGLGSPQTQLVSPADRSSASATVQSSNSTGSSAPGSPDSVPSSTSQTPLTGVVSINGVNLHVPKSWIRESYPTPCGGRPTVDYVLIVTQEPSPSPACAIVDAEPISGVTLAPLDLARKWLNISDATEATTINGVPAQTGVSRIGRIVVVIPSYNVAMSFEASDSEVQSILAAMTFD